MGGRNENGVGVLGAVTERGRVESEGGGGGNVNATLYADLSRRHRKCSSEFHLLTLT